MPVVIALLVIAVIFGVLAFVIKAALWLLVFAALFVVAAFVVGRFRGTSRRA